MNLGDAARLWRERAENARTIAQQMTDPEARLGMLQIARDYTVMAEYAERRSRRPYRIVDCGVPEQRPAELEPQWDLPRQHAVEGMTYQPETLKAICRAFDLAWASIAGNIQPAEVEAARIRLANCLLSLSAEDGEDVGALAAEALRALAPNTARSEREQQS
jgi:hypothetical protein